MICRLCLNKIEEGNIIPLFTMHIAFCELVEMIAKYIRLKITQDDAVSTVICNKCYTNIKDFDAFCAYIEKQQQRLQNDFPKNICCELGPQTPDYSTETQTFPNTVLKCEPEEHSEFIITEFDTSSWNEVTPNFNIGSMPQSIQSPNLSTSIRNKELSPLKQVMQQKQEVSLCALQRKENTLPHIGLHALEHTNNVRIQENQFLIQKTDVDSLPNVSNNDKEYFSSSSWCSSNTTDAAFNSTSDEVKLDEVTSEANQNPYQIHVNCRADTILRAESCLYLSNMIKPVITDAVNETKSPLPLPVRIRGMDKRGQRKTLRNLGLQYITSKGKVVNARSMRCPCKDICRLKCKEKICENLRKNLFDNYWAMGSLNQQRDFIARCIAPVKLKYQYKNSERRANNSFNFLVNEKRIRVCKTFFQNTLGISDVRTVIKTKTMHGKIEPDKRGKHGNQRKKILE